MTTTDVSHAPGPPAEGPSLTPYVPRILLRHLADPPSDSCWAADGTVVFSWPSAIRTTQRA